MIDLLFKGAVVLVTVAVAVGAVVAVGYAFNAWRNKYRDKVTTWLHEHCKNERVQKILLKAVCVFDSCVAGSVNKMVRWVIKAQKPNGSEVTIETSEVSVDVAKGAGCFANDNTLETSDKVLFNDADVIAMLANVPGGHIETREVSIDAAKAAGCNFNEKLLSSPDQELVNDDEIAAMLGLS